VKPEQVGTDNQKRGIELNRRIKKTEIFLEVIGRYDI